MKIGITQIELLANRMRTIQRGSPVPLQLLGVLSDGSYQNEQAVHQQFAQDRLHGEWFSPSKRLLTYISENGKNAFPFSSSQPGL